MYHTQKLKMGVNCQQCFHQSVIGSVHNQDVNIILDYTFREKTEKQKKREKKIYFINLTSENYNPSYFSENYNTTVIK